MDAPNSGSVRVEKHRSGWQRTKGDRWMPAKSLWGNGRNQYVQEPSGETQNNPTSVMAGGIGNESACLAERCAAERSAAERSAAERSAAERSAAERSAAERCAAGRYAAR
jgi:hypothetical protein